MKKSDPCGMREAISFVWMIDNLQRTQLLRVHGHKNSSLAHALHLYFDNVDSFYRLAQTLGLEHRKVA